MQVMKQAMQKKSCLVFNTDSHEIEKVSFPIDLALKV